VAVGHGSKGIASRRGVGPSPAGAGVE
jgi:hypothetical protein